MATGFGWLGMSMNGLSSRARRVSFMKSIGPRARAAGPGDDGLRRSSLGAFLGPGKSAEDRYGIPWGASLPDARTRALDFRRRPGRGERIAPRRWVDVPWT